MSSSRSTLSSFTDAAADAVARAIVSIQRDAQRERELREAQFAARMAELEARLASVSEIERRLADRLATLTDGKDGRDGASVTVDDLRPVLAELVTEAVAALPAPADGRDGVDGKDGERGPQGERGEAGQGVDDIDIELIEEGRTAVIRFTTGEIERAFEVPLPVGPAGRDGVDGKDGERGREGPMGKLPIVREWEDRVYYEGDVVTFAGSAYQAARDTGKAPPNEDWIRIVSAGREGSDGRSFVVRGTYDRQATYSALDVVALNGASFAARREDPGPCPGDGWQLIAAQGKQGKPGAKGDTGMGVRGLPGEPVRSMAISGDGMLVLTNGDGSKVECDLYPILSKIGG